MGCKGCGICCKVITLGKTSMEDIEVKIKESYPNGYTIQDILSDDLLFIYLSWEEVTEEEAIKINPEIVGYGEYYFKCNLLINQQCIIHNLGRYGIKPHVCRGYPYYDGKPDINTLFSNCGFNEDLNK
jgi:Fe-S-cluster containining protein